NQHLRFGHQIRQLVGILLGGAGVGLIGLFGLLPVLVDHAGEVVGLGVLGIQLADVIQFGLGRLELALLDVQLGGEQPDQDMIGGKFGRVVEGLAAIIQVAGFELVPGQAIEHAGTGQVPSRFAFLGGRLGLGLVA